MRTTIRRASSRLRPGTALKILLTLAAPLLWVALTGCVGSPKLGEGEIPEHSATIAVSRSDRWAQKHLRQLQQAEELGVELLFLGDSITNRWTIDASPVWDEFYGDRKAYPLGSGGDRTEHTLWRVEHGQIERLRPKLVVLLIGTNNLVQKGDSPPNTTGEIVDGVHAVVHGLLSKMPETRILLHAIFPRGRGPQGRLRQPVTEIAERLAELPERLAEIADGERVHFIDVGEVFLNEQGAIPKRIMFDALHLTPQGYRLWAEAIEAKVAELLAESP